MRFSSFGLLSLLSPLIGALPFDNTSTRSNELKINSYQYFEEPGLSHGPYKNVINVGDSPQSISTGFPPPQSTLSKRSTSSYYSRRDFSHGHNFDGVSGHGSDDGSDSGGHGSDDSYDSDSESDGDSNSVDEGLVPLSTTHIDPSQIVILNDDPTTSDD